MGGFPFYKWKWNHCFGVNNGNRFKDREAIANGLWLNDNIMVHVGQNMFNFVFTTLAWFLASQFYSLYSPPNTSLPRQLRALTLTEAADEVLDAIRNYEERQRI